VCETIERHVLALEVDPMAFCEIILPLAKEVELQQSKKPSYFLVPNLPSKKRTKRLLDCE
jgi:hypothetical protein